MLVGNLQETDAQPRCVVQPQSKRFKSRRFKMVLAFHSSSSRFPEEDVDCAGGYHFCTSLAFVHTG